MGCRISCAKFEEFSEAIKWALKTKFNVNHIVKILNDFLFVEKYEPLCGRSLRAFLYLCDYLGIPVAVEKTFGAACITQPSASISLITL